MISATAISSTAIPAEPAPVDFLAVLRRSYVLSESRFDEVRDKALSGVYPRDPVPLAKRLVAEGVLTEYQADRLLRNRPHSLLVGRYVILDRIGSGSMGRVYKARHLLMDRVVALKIIAPEYVASPRKIARFQREIRLIGRLDHPNVVRAFDADRISNVPYIAMEYVSGENLNHRLQERGPLPPEEVVEFAAQAAEGLAHAHSQGVVHRDVKPSNLLLSESGQLKLLDFGLGILMEQDSDDEFRTNDGVAVGTIDFMSPEQTCGQEIDGRSDLFSLGCAIYHLMTKRMLYPGNSTIERLAQRAKGERVAIAERHPEFSPRLVHVLEKLLAYRRDDRFQNAGEAADALWSLSPRRARPMSLGKPAHEADPRSRPAPPPARQPAPAPAGVPTPSAGAQPAGGLPPLFRFLIFLAEQSVASILLSALAILFAIFSAGFGLAMIVH